MPLAVAGHVVGGRTTIEHDPGVSVVAHGAALVASEGGLEAPSAHATAGAVAEANQVVTGQPAIRALKLAVPTLCIVPFVTRAIDIVNGPVWRCIRLWPAWPGAHGRDGGRNHRRDGLLPLARIRSAPVRSGCSGAARPGITGVASPSRSLQVLARRTACSQADGRTLVGT